MSSSLSEILERYSVEFFFFDVINTYNNSNSNKIIQNIKNLMKTDKNTA